MDAVGVYQMCHTVLTQVTTLSHGPVGDTKDDVNVNMATILSRVTASGVIEGHCVV